ncbi:MAG: alpha/beta fold hydrolase [Nitritalea sp.]
MPQVEVNGHLIFYVEEGEGEETLVFSHGLLWSHKMFREQLEHFKKRYRVIAYDHPGQGQSEVPTGGMDMETLTADALQFIVKVVGKPVHFLGLSMGGFVGMRLAARHSEWIASLVLLETSANTEPVENLPQYKMLNGAVKLFGVSSAVAGPVMKIMFAQSWLENPLNAEAKAFWTKELKANKRSISRAVEAVIYRKGVAAELGQITCPTLVIVGDEDVATKPEKAKFIQMNIAGAKLHIIPGAGHSCTIEKPEEVNRLLEEWYAETVGI